MRLVTWYCAVVLVLGGACRQLASPPPPRAAKATEARPGEQPASTTKPPAPSSAADDLAGLLGIGSEMPLPDGLVPGGDCPPPPSDAAEQIAAQAEAAIPLKEGLTFAYAWMPTRNEDYECLIQVKKIDVEGFDSTASCDSPGGRGRSLRRVCRADLRSARMLHTLYGAVKVIGPSGEELPETITGATAFSLSSDAFAELKRTGATTHHYVQLASPSQLERDSIGEQRIEGRETIQVIVNDRPVNVPVIKTRGTMKWWVRGRRLEAQETMVILDDDRFPVLIDQYSSNEEAATRIQFTKITYPGAAPGGGALELGGGTLEKGLLEDNRVDVYGIYFDFNSDRIRAESEPVLGEIGSILKRHPDWRLSINGHTDNIGGNGQYNLELSRRRSEAVRTALVDRFGISGDRLSSAGYGASLPKDTNDTPKGRARNRRVELVRHP